MPPPSPAPNAPSEPIRRANGAELLRAKIDRGEAGDKVAFPDPAAVPLGADAEAGGHAPTRAEVDLALRHETRDRPYAPDVEPNDAPSWRMVGIIVGATLLLAVAFGTFG
jgi:hypothetical protein